MTVGSVRPDIEGSGGATEVPDGWVTTRSEKQTPNPETTVELLEQVAGVQVPARRTVLELAQDKHEDGPEAEHDAQLESQFWQLDVVVSKN